MQIEYLREFVAVVDEGQHGAMAARKLFITQSVLSKHMQNLEKEFDSQLFMRTATGIRPTPLGHKAYSAFCSIIDEYDDFCMQAHDDRNHMSGQLSIGILGADIDRYLGPCIHDFSQANPNVSIAYKTEKPQEIVADLLENRLDIGFAPQKSLEDKGLLSYQVIAEDPIKFVMPKDCPAAVRGYAVPEDIADKTAGRAHDQGVHGPAERAGVLRRILAEGNHRSRRDRSGGHHGRQHGRLLHCA